MRALSLKKWFFWLLGSSASLALPTMTWAAENAGHAEEAKRYIFDAAVDGKLKMGLAGLVMLVVIIIIATEKVHRTMIAMFAGSLLILATHTLGNYFELFDLISFERAFMGSDGHGPVIDYEVIGLLTGMMIIVGVLGETGVFEWLALKLFKISKGSIPKLIVLFCITTAVVSAFLDNVTTVILITPVAIQITKLLKMNPLALLIPIILTSNVGGTATLIGDPPNILIGGGSNRLAASAGNPDYALSFNDFIVNLGPGVIIILTVVILQLLFVYRKDLKKCKSINVEKECKLLAKTHIIKHPKLLKYCLTSLGGVVLLFFLHHAFHMSPAVPALAGAAVLMFFRDRIIMKKLKAKGKTKDGVYEASTHEVEVGILKAFEKDVEWPVLAFFVFLFVCVGALEGSGALDMVANSIQTNFGHDILLCAVVIMWVSAFASAFLDNIPFTLVMIPVVGTLITGIFEGNPSINVLWWGLAFGACLGGNGTVIGASANIVTAGIMEKHGIKMSFMDFFKVGFPSMIIQVILATGILIMMFHLNWL